MSPCFIINVRNERVVLIVQVLKDELRHKILLESEHLFLQRGYDRTSLQMIADKVNISKSNLYHYFKNKEELFYELTDSAADGLKRMILRFRSMRFDLNMDAQEFRMLLTEEVLSLLLAEKYGLLLIMEQANGTRYENLRPVMIELIASKIVPMLADEENSPMMAQIMARNLVDGTVHILKNRVRPSEVQCRTESADYLSHTGNARAAIAALRLSRNYRFADSRNCDVEPRFQSRTESSYTETFLPPEVQRG